tara:strand:- start:14212 stop:14760 length:549 start_codon:yes stop_codon:yes gene_type:complete
MRKIYKCIYFNFLKWKIIGQFPKIDKMIIAVVPHTHWNDFFLGLLIRRIIGEPIHFVGKKELFGPLSGWFFKSLGGHPVNRDSNQNTVNSIAEIFKQKKIFRLALSPEGTRKKVNEWKTGFYYVAKLAKVPICLVAFDYGKKEIVFHPPFYPTMDKNNDINFLKKQFKGVIGKVPEYSWTLD